MWSDEAACLGLDPALFHPEKGDEGGIAAARDVCCSCPVIRPCLQYALANLEDGVWGGSVERQRRAWRRETARGHGEAVIVSIERHLQSMEARARRLAIARAEALEAAREATA